MIEIVSNVLGFFLIILVLIQTIWLLLIFISFFAKKNKNKKIKYPFVSIIIPAYNEEKNIAETIKAALNLNYPKNKYEIIVIDDGSTDKTYEIAKAFKKVKAFKIKHSGKSSALNYALNFVKGEYILVLDADTILEKNSLKNAIKLLNEKVGAITFALKVKNAKNFLTWFQYSEYLYNNLIRIGLSLLKEGTTYIWGCATLYKAELVKKLKFREVATEDLDLNLRIQSLGYKILISENSIAYTNVPENIKNFSKQRVRWFMAPLISFDVFLGALTKKLPLTLKIFSFPSLFFWIIFSLFSFALNLYQFLYWLSYQKTFYEISIYFANWFTFFGNIYNTIKMISGEWKINLALLFGTISGFLSFFTYLISLIYFKEKDLKFYLPLLFLFPYYYYQNFLAIFSVLKFLRLRSYNKNSSFDKKSF